MTNSRVIGRRSSKQQLNFEGKDSSSTVGKSREKGLTILLINLWLPLSIYLQCKCTRQRGFSQHYPSYLNTFHFIAYIPGSLCIIMSVIGNGFCTFYNHKKISQTFFKAYEKLMLNNRSIVILLFVPGSGSFVLLCYLNLIKIFFILLHLPAILWVLCS